MVSVARSHTKLTTSRFRRAMPLETVISAVLLKPMYVVIPELVAVRLPPVTQTVPVENDAALTQKFEDNGEDMIRSPPAIVNVPAELAPPAIERSRTCI